MIRYFFTILFILSIEKLFSQGIDFVSSIDNLQLSMGDIEKSDGSNVMNVCEIVDSVGVRGYMIANFNTQTSNFNCYKQYLDTNRVKELVFSPILKINSDTFATLGPAWNPSRLMLVLFNSQCDTILTKEYTVGTGDSLYFLLIHELISTKDGGFVCVGSIGEYKSQDSLGTQILIAEFDKEFNLIWQKSLGDYRNQYGFDILEYNDNLLYAFGLDRKDNDQNYDSIRRPLILYKINLEGDLVESIQHTDEIRSSHFQFITTPDNGFISCSSEMQDLYFNNNIPGNIYSHNSIFKVDSDFNYQWETHYGEKLFTKNNLYYDLVESIDGDGVVACGSVADSVNGKLIYYGVVTKVNWNGDSIWTRIFLPQNSLIPVKPDCAFTKIITTDQGYFLSGIVALDTPRVEYHSTQQLWFLSLDSFGCLEPGCNTTAISNEGNIAGSEFSIYPNPASNQCTIHIKGTPSSTSLLRLRIINEGGEIIKEMPISGNDVNFLVDVEGLNPGIYFVQLTDQLNRQENKKLMVVR